MDHYHLSTGNFTKFLRNIISGILFLLVIISASILLKQNDTIRLIQVGLMIIGPMLIVFFALSFTRRAEIRISGDTIRIDDLDRIQFQSITKYKLTNKRMGHILIVTTQNHEKLYFAPESSFSSTAIDHFNAFTKEFERLHKTIL